MKCMGIIGLGSIGRRHLRLAKQLRPDMQIVAVRSGHGGDIPETQLISSTVGSIEEAFDRGIEAAVLSTPASLHGAQLRTLVDARLPFFVEKPLAMGGEEARDLAVLVEQSDATGLVGYNLRYSASLQHFGDLLSAQTVGEILHVSIDCGSYLPDWRPGRDYRATPSAKADLGGGVLRELSHELDYALWLFGPFRNISASITNSGTLDIDVEDRATLHLESVEGYSMTLHLDFCRRHPNRSCTVFGTHGQMTWDGIAQTVELQDTSNTRIQQWFPEERDEMYRRQLHHFFGVVEDGQSPRVPVAVGAEVMRLIDAAWDAQWKGTRIPL